VVIVAAVLLVAALCAQSASARVRRAAPVGDRLTGGRAADVLVGAAGDDILRGEGGNDRLAPVGMPEIRWSMGAAGFEPAPHIASASRQPVCFWRAATRSTIVSNNRSVSIAAAGAPAGARPCTP
jgi:hypothetical protein